MVIFEATIWTDAFERSGGKNLLKNRKEKRRGIWGGRSRMELGTQESFRIDVSQSQCQKKEGNTVLIEKKAMR